MSAHYDIAIVGGGIIGLACAYYLRQAGREVCVVDQGRIGRGASHANCGLVTPSHALPLTQPGMVTKGLKWMLRGDSPFYIKPDLDLGKFLWLLKFANRCNTGDMLAAMHGRKAILDSSRQLYDELFAAHDMDCEWHDEGVLFVFKHAAGMHGYEQTNALLAEHNLAATPLTGTALHQREPALLDDVYGAWHYPMDAHLKPDKLVSEWLRVIREMGVTIREDFRVGGIDRHTLYAARDEIHADRIILATGAWSAKLNRALGCRIPIEPGKGYSMTFTQPRQPVKIPCLFQEVKMVATPFDTGYRLGGTMEFAGFDESINETRLGAIRRSAGQYLREPEGAEITETWHGWRPMTWDGLPIIDQAPRRPHILIVAGHNMLGLSMAPATGKLAAELITGEAPHIDREPYRYARKFA
ncbi:NAD(P)/FAD-dependent oxidoreductase [Cerasicoccus fimbriatus]|uniref:NAD(P)/FAD-dependent oxidoreductase n=1 Tax=Cerasicoccus fimbriatus TaxID=3014554 RepID=UPI0022B59FB9|nr:FAD-dependent oxidoreductase [Cerasicoccus sp. TK19100]